jgi:hypothetical protein
MGSHFRSARATDCRSEAGARRRFATEPIASRPQRSDATSTSVSRMPVWLAIPGRAFLVFYLVGRWDDVCKDRITRPPHMFRLAERTIRAVSNLG